MLGQLKVVRLEENAALVGEPYDDGSENNQDCSWDDGLVGEKCAA